ncbi:N-methyl-L-tryptophan oxidase [soil metagenome]
MSHLPFSSSKANSSQSFDVVVVGAGAMGSATAYHLAQDGQRVLLLEQFQIGHLYGSSHGGSRIIRYTHEDIDFTRWMPATFALWQRLEHESGQSLMQLTNGLYFGLTNDPFLSGAQHALHTLGFPYRLLTAGDVRKEFPQFQLEDKWIALEQTETGILAATRCVQTLVTQAIRHGATVQEACKVLTIRMEGEGVAVRYATHSTETEVYAQRVVITAGPWVHQLLDPLLGYRLPLTPTHQQVAYFRVEKPELYAIGRCPIHIFFDDNLGAYGFPIYEKPGYVKVAIELADIPIDPDQPATIDQQALQLLSATVAERLVGVDPEPQWTESCRYTETPNRDFIIDRHPEYPQIIFATGFSGRGFKHSIAIGRTLADMTQSEPGVYHQEFWLPRFALKVFAPRGQQ